MTALDFDQILDAASLPETTVALCLNGRLRREYEQVKARIEDRAAQADAERAAAQTDPDDTRLASKTPDDAPAEPDPEQADLDRLAEQMQQHTVAFVVRALPAQDWQRLVEAHPPRRDPKDATKVDPRDWKGVNSATFEPEAVRVSIAEPAPTACDQLRAAGQPTHRLQPDPDCASCQTTGERWQKLAGKLTDIQLDKLVEAAMRVNRRDDDVPFSPSGSGSPRSSAAA